MAYAEQTMIPVIQADEETRSGFLVRVYQHLALALLAFVAFEAVLMSTGVARTMYEFVAGNRGAWLLLLGGFMIVNFIASGAAHRLGEPAVQYGALFAMAAAEALIFAPFLYLVFNIYDDGSSVVLAAIITAIGFAALSAVAFVTRRDLSFLRPIIMWASIAALGLIVAGVAFGFTLGPLFSVAMIGLAGASILYRTQNIIRQYPAWAYVGAAVSLFGSLMLMFWYVLSLLTRR